MKEEGLPFRVWIRRVDNQNRIRLTSDLRDVVLWVPKKPGTSITCFGFPGAFGQMQLSPDEPAGAFKTALAIALQKNPAQSGDASTDWIRFARYAAGAWPVTLVFDAEPERFALTLPREARELKASPASGSIAVIFGSGHILEIWDEQTWGKHISEVAKDVTNYAERAAEALLDR